MCLLGETERQRERVFVFGEREREGLGSSGIGRRVVEIDFGHCLETA